MKDPAILFYTSDFLTGCADLTMEERGQYITMLCLQHQKGRLSPRTITLSIPNVSEYVLAKFDVDDDGNYYNKRLEQEILKRENYAQSRRENGKKKWEKQKQENAYANDSECICKNYANAQAMHTENENINRDIIKNDYIDIDNLFNIFWLEYPKKVAKEYAKKIFIKLKPNQELFDEIMNGLKKHKSSKAWQDKQFIPYPATWLNQRRWEDEDIEQGHQASYGDADDAFEAALKRSYEE